MEEEKLLNIKYQGKKTQEYFDDLKKLKEGYPLDYLIGWSDFLNAKIDLSYKPLIPRVETEYWVWNYVFPEIKKEMEVLDLFAGSGAIGIGLLKNFDFLKVDFGEIKDENLKQIEKNLKLNNLESREVEIIKTDVFSNIRKKYDFILANPPYISKNKIELVQKSVLNFEDNLALFAEDDGLFFIKKLILEFKNFLKDGGKIFIEFDDFQKNMIEDFLVKNKIEKFKFLKDQFDRWRVLIIEK